MSVYEAICWLATINSKLQKYKSDAKLWSNRKIKDWIVVTLMNQKHFPSAVGEPWLFFPLILWTVCNTKLIFPKLRATFPQDFVVLWTTYIKWTWQPYIQAKCSISSVHIFLSLRFHCCVRDLGLELGTAWPVAGGLHWVPHGTIPLTLWWHIRYYQSHWGFWGWPSQGSPQQKCS